MANKYFKGTTEDFKNFLEDLYIQAQTSEDASIKYEDIKKSVVYISEHMALDPVDSSHCEEGAVYAHGAIISGGSDGPEWEDDIDPSCN